MNTLLHSISRAPFIHSAVGVEIKLGRLREWSHKKGNAYVLACWKALWGDQEDDYYNSNNNNNV